MWLYVPNISISSPSAPEEPALISASSWQFQALEQSAWWRGKPSPSRTWSQRCAKVSWLRHLCGVMPEPSTAALGVAQLTASLVASRASLIASLESDLVRMTSVTCGPRLAASSCNPGLGSSSSRTSGACWTAAAPKEFSETFENLVLRMSSDCLQRLKRAQASGVSVSSFWQSPTTRDAKGQSGRGNRIKRGQNGRLHVANLCDQIEDLDRPDLIRSVSFRETLMLWPDEFCDIATMHSACSETALSHWKRLMRSALLALGLPREAPPAQLALFG